MKVKFIPRVIAVIVLLVACVLGILIMGNKKTGLENAVLVAAWADQKIENGKNTFEDLSVPTYVNKVGEDYFIVDCYHNQVIYHQNLSDPLSSFRVMTKDIIKGHTIVSDGVVYLVDDTENNRILVFEKREDGFLHTQTLSDIGIRPHFLTFDEQEQCFYAWSSMTGEMFVIRRDQTENQMYVSAKYKIEELDQVYVRSFTIIGEEVYFVSGNESIIVADKDTFRVKKRYPVPADMGGMIQLVKIQDYFYFTVSTDSNGNQDAAGFFRTKDLAGLIKGDYEDVYSNFETGGTPYYITRIEDTYYLTEHRVPGHSIWSFQVEDNEIVKVKAIY